MNQCSPLQASLLVEIGCPRLVWRLRPLLETKHELKNSIRVVIKGWQFGSLGLKYLAGAFKSKPSASGMFGPDDHTCWLCAGSIFKGRWTRPLGHAIYPQRLPDGCKPELKMVSLPRWQPSKRLSHRSPVFSALLHHLRHLHHLRQRRQHRQHRQHRQLPLH